MPSSIVVFSPRPSQPPPVPRRARPAAIRALAAFQPAVAWLYGCVLGLDPPANDHPFVNLRDVHPALRDRLEEEVVRAVAGLDPIAESVARRRARQLAAERIAQLFASSTPAELADPDYLEDRGRAFADAVLDRYRQHLVYGPSSVSPQVAS